MIAVLDFVIVACFLCFYNRKTEILIHLCIVIHVMFLVKKKFHVSLVFPFGLRYRVPSNCQCKNFFSQLVCMTVT